MSLTFGGATTDRVDIGSAAALDNLATRSEIHWFYLTTFTGGKSLSGKEADTGVVSNRIRLSGTTELDVQQVQTVSNLQYITNNSALTTNKWWFAAFTYTNSGANRAKIYVGDLATLATERTYGTPTDGSGTKGADATKTQKYGNDGSTGNALQGRMALSQIYNRVLTLGEIQSLQFRPRVLSGCVDYHHHGFNGTGTQPDWSGNGNAGTITGATAGNDHVPLGPWFGYDMEWQGAFSSAAATGWGPLIGMGRNQSVVAA